MIGRIEPEIEKDPKQRKPDSETIEFKDPNELSSYELFKEMSKIAVAVGKLKDENQKSRDSLEILMLAAENLELEIGYRSIELNLGGTK